MEFENDFSLKEWAKDKPLSILQLDPADRAVLRIADNLHAIPKIQESKHLSLHAPLPYSVPYSSSWFILK
ncbi:hypothetical protein PYW08_009361 [Mythimna loreyi]|uniref:Uncharacterized protein n=1 Tax=Mythimna loreyi TaxID=667449 RepID=A0ACC2Q998_9NEOP|nr:hypothetical protein PYW08_009361 [Mythimna loreyi]